MLPGSDNDKTRPVVSAYFDDLYSKVPRYWWRQESRYATDPDSFPHSLLTQLTLRLIQDRLPARVLDLGAGEGADAIRLARLGCEVTAVEISNVGAEKIMKFASEAGAVVNVQVSDIAEYRPDGEFDLIICNGVLHYISDKKTIIDRMQRATSPGGLNVVSLWSTYTPVPEYHNRVPVFCDDEDGIVAGMYRSWIMKLCYFERDKTETAHSDMPDHSHSHIKLIARKTAPS